MRRFDTSRAGAGSQHDGQLSGALMLVRCRPEAVNCEWLLLGSRLGRKKRYRP